MTQISAALVKELRELTDAPMLECRNALCEADGDIKKAEEVLRVRLGCKAAKAAGRCASEGMVFAAVFDDCKSAVMLEVNCETDFVVRNDSFRAYVEKLALFIGKQRPDSIASLSGMMFDGDCTFEDARIALIGKIGENIELRRFVCLTTQHSFYQYVHNDRIGVIVEYECADEAVGKDLSLQIAATKPLCVSSDQVPQDVLRREREIFKQQSESSGKSAAVVEKMVDGRIAKFLAEISLLEQPFVKDNSKTVQQMLRENQGKVFSFVTYVKGEQV